MVIRPRYHKPINEGGIDIDIRPPSSSENLDSVIDGVAFGANAKKLEDNEMVLFLAIFYDVCVNWSNLVNLSAFLEKGNRVLAVLRVGIVVV